MASARPAGGSVDRSPIGRASMMAGFACVLLAGTSAARAADITYERLANPEPQNWLMHHHDFGGQRFSPLDTIDRSNIKNLKLLFAVALGGSSRDDSLEATPLVEDGYMYVVDSSGIVSKIDVRSGMLGPILWQMAPTKKFDPEDFAGFLALLPAKVEGLPLRHHSIGAVLKGVQCVRDLPERG